jgi:hypothetical protein
MLCKKVLSLLSEFFDGVLDDDTSVQVSQHLGQCIRCRKEFNSLSALHNRLSSLDRVQAPEYLHSLVQHRLAKEPWRAHARNELERWWSIVRTTERIWYATRAMGTLVAFVLFMMISMAITPFYIQAGASRDSLTFDYGRQVKMNVSKIFGVRQIPAKAGRKDPAAINPLYVVKYADSTLLGGTEDDFSVITMVDSSGAAKVEGVLRSPSDETLLTKFNIMLATARFRPAREYGYAVESPMVFTFSKIFVSD